MFTSNITKKFLMTVLLTSLLRSLSPKDLPAECFIDPESLESDDQVHKPAQWFKQRDSWRKLGEGMAGLVYEATVEGFKVPIAVKVTELNEDNVAEISSIAKFSNQPGFPEYYRCEATKNKIYLYQQKLFDITKDMNFVFDTMHRKDLIVRLVMYKELTLALKIIHKEFVHNDIKPENIMADSVNINHLYLIDMGMLSQKHIVYEGGTPQFKSPEFSTSEVKVDEQDDIWALTLSIAEIEMSPSHLRSFDFGDWWVENIIPQQASLSFLYTNIRNYFDKRYKNELNEQCGDQSRFAFMSLIFHGLHPERAKRLNTDQFIERLNSAIDLCQKFKDQKSGVSLDNHSNQIIQKKEVVGPVEVAKPVVKKHEPMPLKTNEIVFDSNATQPKKVEPVKGKLLKAGTAHKQAATNPTSKQPVEKNLNEVIKIAKYDLENGKGPIASANTNQVGKLNQLVNFTQGFDQISLANTTDSNKVNHKPTAKHHRSNNHPVAASNQQPNNHPSKGMQVKANEVLLAKVASKHVTFVHKKEKMFVMTDIKHNNVI
jgi:serine/threonine protein kinase